MNLSEQCRRTDSDVGQSTVEYAIVSLLTLAMVVALWSVVSSLRESASLVDHIEAFASHTISLDGAWGLIGDTLLF